MSKLFRVFIIIMSVVFISIYLFYAISFGLEFMDFAEAAKIKGFRKAVSKEGDNEIAFYADAATLILLIAAILIIPSILVLAAIVYFFKRLIKRRIKKKRIIINK